MHTGNTECGLTSADADNYFKYDLEVTGKCATGKKTNGNDFFYKASAARCFGWYAEFQSEYDC